MALVPLSPIGRPRSEVVDDATFAEYRREVREREQKLEAARKQVHAGWGEKYKKRVHEKGKLTARERLERLIDPDSRPFEVGTFVNHGIEFEGGQKSPGAGVVTTFARI